MMKWLVTKQMVALAAVAMIVALCTSSAQAVDANDPNNDSLFDPNRVFTLNITMDANDWDTLRFSCPNDGWCGEPPHSYWPATLSCGDLGPMLVGIRRKSDKAEPNETDPQKVSIKIDINLYVPGQLFAGKKKLSLECGSDKALVTETLSWNIYQDVGHVASRAAWVKVYVNGSYRGLYGNVEQVDKIYLTDHGIDNGGFLYKMQETIETQRTRELETSPFEFNWYPFDHPTDDNNPEVPAPNDWLDQALWRVDMNNLLTLAAAENFIAGTDGIISKMNNYWYYDWSTDPCGTDPNFQQPRLYLPWDLDTSLAQTEFPIMNTGLSGGPLEDGLINELDEGGTPFAEPTFQADYIAIYNTLMGSSMSLSNLISEVNNIESVIATEVDADPYTKLTEIWPAAVEFQRIRDFLSDRTDYVTAQLELLLPLPGTPILDDGFEGTTWDANFNDVASTWTDETTRVNAGSHAAGADLGDGTGYFTSDALDTNDANAVYVDFYFQQDQADTFTFEYNGSAGWSAPNDLTALGGDHEWLQYRVAITDSNYFVPDFKIRFNAAFVGGGTRSVEVDDVLITKTVPPPAIISGTILDPGSAPVAGVSVDADSGGGSDVTDANGDYSLTVPYDWSGTVTPTDADYTFAPTNRVYANVTSDQSAQDYTGTDICDLFPDGIFDLRDVDVISENWLTAGPAGDINNSALVDLVDFGLLADKF